MKKTTWKKIKKLNKNGLITGICLLMITILQLPEAIKNMSIIACIGQISNKEWLIENNHSEANIIAVKHCNGISKDYKK